MDFVCNTRWAVFKLLHKNMFKCFCNFIIINILACMYIIWYCSIDFMHKPSIHMLQLFTFNTVCKKTLKGTRVGLQWTGALLKDWTSLTAGPKVLTKHIEIWCIESEAGRLQSASTDYKDALKNVLTGVQSSADLITSRQWWQEQGLTALALALHESPRACRMKTPARTRWSPFCFEDIWLCWIEITNLKHQSVEQ